VIITENMVISLNMGLPSPRIEGVGFAASSEREAKNPELGAFWAGVNEPPPYEGEEEALLQRRAVSSPGKKEVNDEIPAPHPALGG
jgi:hypothetical protein